MTPPTPTPSEVLRIELPIEWIPLPDRDAGIDVDEWVDTTVSERTLSEEVGTRLRQNLRRVIEVAHGLSAGSRRAHALVTRPELGRVDALLSLRLAKVTDAAYGNYLEAVQALTSGPRGELLNRRVDEVVLPKGPAIVTSDIVIPLGGGGPTSPITERAVVALFPTGWASMAEFTLLTQDLAVFDDARDYLLTIASEEVPSVPGRGDNE